MGGAEIDEILNNVKDESEPNRCPKCVPKVIKIIVNNKQQNLEIALFGFTCRNPLSKQICDVIGLIHVTSQRSKIKVEDSSCAIHNNS